MDPGLNIFVAPRETGHGRQAQPCPIQPATRALFTKWQLPDAHWSAWPCAVLLPLGGGPMLHHATPLTPYTQCHTTQRPPQIPMPSHTPLRPAFPPRSLHCPVPTTTAQCPTLTPPTCPSASTHRSAPLHSPQHTQISPAPVPPKTPTPQHPKTYKPSPLPSTSHPLTAQDPPHPAL